jgi:outer membrane protein assembly factor BamA
MKYSTFVYRIFICSVFSIPGSNSLLAQDSIKIGNLCIDSTENQFFIGKINLKGNQKTHDGIILRELTFKVGDCLNETLLKNAINQSRTNLLKLPLFNFVSIELIPINSSLCNIDIIVEERWFLWPQLAIINNERNFNTWLEEHDFSRLDYRLSVKQYNTLGLNHIIRGGVSYGYTRELSLGYQNIAIGRNKKHLIGFYGSYSLYKSFFYRTYNNKQESFTSSNDDVLLNKNFRIEYFFRPAISIYHKLYISFQQVDISDSLLLVSPVFLAGSKKHNNFIEAQYHFIFDKRDSRSYPLSGSWLNFSIIKTGFRINNSSEVNLLNFALSIKQYYPIEEKLYGAHSFTIRKSMNGSQPYYYKENLGYIDFIRGFEYYVIEGDDYYLLKNGLKYEILPQTIKYLNFIPVKKFKKIHYAIYLDAFIDIGYAHDKNAEALLRNNMSDKVLYSFGLGFDLVTYYDKVLNIEYSFNSLKQKGIFIHFIAPI